MTSQPNLNLPNLITICRILLVPVFAIFILEDKIAMACIVFLVAGISDGLDGFLARILQQKTVLGALLDPLADKLLLTTAFIFLAMTEKVPPWISVIVVSRDILILGGIALLILFSKTPAIRPTFLSKCTTFFQLITVLYFLTVGLVVHEIIYVTHLLLYITCFFTVISGIHYITVGLKVWNAPHPAVSSNFYDK